MDVDEVFKNSIKELNEFFEINWIENFPELVIVPDRKKIDELMGRKTEDWMVGWIGKNKVYALDSKNYEKESCHKYSEDEYSKLIKHELSHCYFLKLSKYKSEPDWLWEGTALFVSGQIKTRERPLKFEDFLEFYSKKSKYVYRESGFAVEFLVEKYGKDKLLKLIKNLAHNEKEFNEKFKEIYGFELKYENFN
ncbi:hypothetical protein HN681_01845 [archaeon]|mgnify:CR=1|jgi:hypothetical protein|nr:hypothetical protein [archaeon]MBT3731095.1 hypothetical protein [archaeon]MBT4670208.1 hypothetical protein [archaeon]MBT5030502.1 hypothetical protein [archaeon]MBT5287855.1 hypothetical protein [archaeon]